MKQHYLWLDINPKNEYVTVSLIDLGVFRKLMLMLRNSDEVSV